MADKKMIRILATSAHCETVNALECALEGADFIELCKDGKCDCVVALLDSDGKIDTAVAAGVLEAIGCGSIVLPLSVTDTDAPEVSTIASLIKKIFCDVSSEDTDTSSDGYATVEELLSFDCSEEISCDVEDETACETQTVEEIKNSCFSDENKFEADIEPEKSVDEISDGETEFVEKETISVENISDTSESTVKAESVPAKCICGADVEPDMMFCWVCGRRLYSDNTPCESENVKFDLTVAEAADEKTLDASSIKEQTSEERETSCESATISKTEQTRAVCSCGADIIPDTRFCWNCGKCLDVPATATPEPAPTVAATNCAACGAEISPRDKFCFSCGKPIL